MINERTIWLVKAEANIIKTRYRAAQIVKKRKRLSKPWLQKSDLNNCTITPWKTIEIIDEKWP